MTAGKREQHQLILAVNLRDDATFANYLVPPPVKPLIDSLRAQSLDSGEAQLYVWGSSGSGKSHLLQASCQDAEGEALYLPLAEFAEADPVDILQGMESLQRICLDDLQAVAGDDAWELALFNLINRARESGCRLVFAATAAPRALPVTLPDLQSRLGWGAVFQLPRLEDADKLAILQFRAARRGLAMPDGVARYIISRAPRQMAELLALLDRLDQASLAQKRAVSRPFVKEVLGW